MKILVIKIIKNRLRFKYRTKKIRSNVAAAHSCSPLHVITFDETLSRSCSAERISGAVSLGRSRVGFKINEMNIFILYFTSLVKIGSLSVLCYNNTRADKDGRWPAV